VRPGGVRRRFTAGVVLLLVVFAAGCGGVAGLGGEVTGSGNPVTKQYDYSDFSGVRVDSAFAATVTRGDAFAVSVTADDNLVKYLRIQDVRPRHAASQLPHPPLRSGAGHP
jgi:hypothetical protein